LRGGRRWGEAAGRAREELMRLQFVGCGDAFGSGGRFNTCFHVVGRATNFLIDCGASSLVGLRRLQIDREAIDAILITHFHGDHFGGIPFLLLEAQIVSKRTRPLTLAGPRGLAARYAKAMDAAFPSSPQMPTRFALTFLEIEAGSTAAFAGLRVTAFPVVHTEAAGPCLGYRIEVEGRTIAYSGDTEWTDSLIPLGHGADLFICEAYTRNKKVPSHTDLTTLEQHLDAIQPKRLVLTHMGEEMLGQVNEVPFETAFDGMIVEL
jgi:ribonuclease BN (tRNA processing enzyme)